MNALRFSLPIDGNTPFAGLHMTGFTEGFRRALWSDGCMGTRNCCNKELARKFLYVWEYGNNLGHLMAMLPIAVELRRQGWEGVFALPSKAGSLDVCIEILAEKGFQYIDNPYNRVCVKRPGSVRAHIDVLRSLDAFQSPEFLDYHLRAWNTVVAEVDPDLVIGDFAPVALMAATLRGIPTVALDSGYFYPDTDLDKLPLFNLTLDVPASAECARQVRQDELHFVRFVNQVLAQYSSFRLESAQDIYRCTRTLWLNYPELSPFPHKSSKGFIGAHMLPCDAGCLESIRWPKREIPRPKVFVYLRLDTMQAIRILQVLNSKTELDIIACLPDAGEVIAAKSINPHIQYQSAPIKLEKLLDEANLVICHGGIGLVHQALWAGVPVLTAPTHHEQKLNSENVARLGYGESLHYSDYSPDAIHLAIENILSNEKYVVKARGFHLSHTPLDVSQLYAEIIEAFEARVPAPKVESRPGFKRLERKICVADLDVIFLSYDEPNADDNWLQVRSVFPSAKRVHGVKGLDASHKAAAEAAQGERFLLIDGDNQVSPELASVQLELPVNYEQAIALQWCSENCVNGLRYAAGGVKIWNRELLLNMASHESAAPEPSAALALDFWNQPGYFVFKNVYSTSVINFSPFQAFRAGFREGVKYSKSIGADTLRSEKRRGSNNSLLRRLGIWASVGADVKHGVWAQIGARKGILYACEAFAEPDDSLFSCINDYEWFRRQWARLAGAVSGDLGDASFATAAQDGAPKVEVEAVLADLNEQLRVKAPAVTVIEMGARDSRNFKESMKEIYGHEGKALELLIDGGAL